MWRAGRWREGYLTSSARLSFLDEKEFWYIYTMKKKNLSIAIGSVLILISIISIVGWQTRYNFLPQLIASSFDNKSESYPEVDVSNLSSVQQKIISITKQEFKTQPNYKKYSDGNNEPWCADFVSWVYKESGVSVKNPVSGSWRIPGTYTLRDYLNEEDRLVTDSEHKPQVGDLMLYDNPNSFGQHVNIVIKIHKNGDITTIGGNEPGGIRLKTHKAHLESGFVGYGLLGG